ncbi:hypothetical protein NL676_022651 [Syzygium grande]|nr:hypothetical protein NL676_022651 [Syzygium grande]
MPNQDETNIISEILHLPNLPDDFAEASMQMQSADSTPPCLSSNMLSQREEDSHNESPHHAKKPSSATFRDSDSAEIFDDESVFDEVDSFPVKHRAENNGKKGSCYRCFKGNRFTEKDVCIVCYAKYCQKCVLRAMGSMPEGRKCVTCLGCRIDEMKPSDLGKCSRIVKWLLPESEIKQIMSSEVSCPANQIPPNLVYVNGEAPGDKELLRLRGCPNPPKKPWPGYYWYDKVAGFWGKSAGIPCEGGLDLWVAADGSYQIEGQECSRPYMGQGHKQFKRGSSREKGKGVMIDGCHSSVLALNQILFLSLYFETVRWPSSRGGQGFTEVANKVHSMGLKFGIHIMRGISTQAVNAKTPILDTTTVCSFYS